MGKKRGRKMTRLPMMHRILTSIRYQKRMKAMPRRNQKPRCKCCGDTVNLTSGSAAGNLIWLCPGAAREANNPRM